MRVAELAYSQSASMAARAGLLLEEKTKKWKAQDGAFTLL